MIPQLPSSPPQTLKAVALLLAGLACSVWGNAFADQRPNVIVIMSDDQGGGDYGFLGNPVIRTPNLDAMRERSGLLSHFYVSPVCAPTRASLMTGRYNYRTRCIDTYIGRAMMDPAEITLAEYLGQAGYRTGIYGKWHLGDNYPMRPMDQGFDESLIHRGGGIGQPSDPVGAEGKYTDPTLIRDGNEIALKGYCTDIFFDAAIEFVRSAVKENQPFFSYIATNAPHGPFHDVPEALYQEYRQVDFSPILVNKMSAKRLEQERDKLARIAAMITNIDENVGKLFRSLDQLGVTENTIVIYLNDNGPNSQRYVGNMRGMKTHVDDGGVRSPLLFHWPKQVAAGEESDALCAHIDLAPTILEACSVKPYAEPKMDGRSFLSLLNGTDRAWPTRTLVLQSHRGDEPVRYHHFALHEHPWKLVHPSGFGREGFSGAPKLELYHLVDDPKQQVNLADKNPETLERLKKEYDAWFDDVSSTRENNYAPPRIVIGTTHERRSVLTRQDWRHTAGRPWAPDSNGVWLLEAPVSGEYSMEVVFASGHAAGKASVRIGDQVIELEIPAGDRVGYSTNIELPAGQFSLGVDVTFDGKTHGPHQVILTRQD